MTETIDFTQTPPRTEMTRIPGTCIFMRIQFALNHTINAGFQIDTTGNDAIVSRIKLELGDTNTLANDPPMDFGRELAVCQRFFRRDRIGMVHSDWVNGQFAVYMYSFEIMRTTPSTTFTGPANSADGYFLGRLPSLIVIPNVVWSSLPRGNQQVQITAQHSSIVTNDVLMVFLEGSLSLSADL